MNFAPCLPAVFVAGSFRQLELLVRQRVTIYDSLVLLLTPSLFATLQPTYQK